MIEKYYYQALKEVEQVIKNVNSETCKTKISKEKTMTGKVLYHPSKLK